MSDVVNIYAVEIIISENVEEVVVKLLKYKTSMTVVHKRVGMKEV